MNGQKKTSAANQILILLGSNIDPEHHLIKAYELIDRSLTILQVSRIYETPAYGMDAANFLNAAVAVQSDLTPETIKHQILRKIEKSLGRTRSANKFTPRTIDLDIIVVGDTVLDDELFEQPHVSLPVSDLRADLIEPTSGQKLEQLAEKLLRHSKATIREDIRFPTIR